jgi:aspartate ammonia-lyase
MLSTYLVPLIGYDRASEIAKEALKTGKNIREVVREKGMLSEEKLDEIFREIA